MDRGVVAALRKPKDSAVGVLMRAEPFTSEKLRGWGAGHRRWGWVGRPRPEKEIQRVVELTVFLSYPNHHYYQKLSAWQTRDLISGHTES